MTHPFRQLSGSRDPSPASIMANQRMVQLTTIALVLVYGTSFVHGRTYPLISCSFLVQHQHARPPINIPPQRRSGV